MIRFFLMRLSLRCDPYFVRMTSLRGSVATILANYRNTTGNLVMSTKETRAFANWRSKSRNIGFWLFPNQLSLFKIYSNQSPHPARGIVLDPSFCELAKQILCCGVAEQKLQQRLGRDSPDLRYLKLLMVSRFSSAGLAQKNSNLNKRKNALKNNFSRHLYIIAVSV